MKPAESFSVLSSHVLVVGKCSAGDGLSAKQDHDPSLRDKLTGGPLSSVDIQSTAATHKSLHKVAPLPSVIAH